MINGETMAPTCPRSQLSGEDGSGRVTDPKAGIHAAHQDTILLVADDRRQGSVVKSSAKPEQGEREDEHAKGRCEGQHYAAGGHEGSGENQ